MLPISSGRAKFWHATDAFYGLAADPFNLRAVERVYDIKTRSRHKPLSLLIGAVSQAELSRKICRPSFICWPSAFGRGR